MTEEIGPRLEWARLRAGLTLEDVHSETGLARGHICEIEHGKKLPSVKSIIVLAKAVRVTVAFLLGEQEWPGWGHQDKKPLN